MSEKWEELRDSIYDSIEKQAKDFLDSHADARAFLRERAGRLAKLSYLYYSAKDGDEKKIIADDMATVRQAISNELASAALDAAADAKALFGKIVSTAFGILIDSAPVIGKIIGGL